MPRFERHLPAVPDRVVVNPFTRTKTTLEGRPARDEAVELSLDGVAVVIERTKGDGKLKTKREVMPSEPAARAELARQIRKLRGRGFEEVRPQPARASSALLVGELLAEGSPRFVSELTSLAGKKLVSIADRWCSDERPAARRMLLDYVLGGCDRPGQRLLVKRLLAAASKREDDELMGCFLVALDRMEKRWLVEREGWDDDANEPRPEEALATSPLLPLRAREGAEGEGDAFSVKTRLFMSRWVFRYFRRLAFRDPGRYIGGVAPAIARFTDADLADVAKLLDAWSLVHVLYHGSEVLVRDPRGIRVAPDRALADLEFAPLKKEAWAGSFEVAFALARDARSRPVARFAIHLLTKHFAPRIEGLTFGLAKELLSANHDETRAFMVGRLGKVAGLGGVAIGEWLALLDGGSFELLPELVRLFRAHVSPRRLSLEECVALALSPAGAVAELGFEWVKERASKGIGALERQRLLKLVSARAPLVRAAATDYVARLIAEAPESKPEEVRELIDAGAAEVRARGMALVREVPRFAKSAVVWASMAESPHPEVREKLLDELASRAEGPRVPEASLARVWSTTLLSIHRGGRAKPKALRAIAEALVDEPARAEELVPLMRIALRSVRPAERRSALAAIAQAAQAHAEVRSAVRRHLPELELGAIDVEVIA